MIGDGINDGDSVIIHPQSTAENGDTGTAWVDRFPVDGAALVHRADEACYAAKAAGRNCVKASARAGRRTRRENPDAVQPAKYARLPIMFM